MKEPKDWTNYERVFDLKNNLRQYNFDVSVIHSSCITNVLWPGEQPTYIIQVINNLDSSVTVDGKIDIIRYGTEGRPNDIWLPQVFKIADGHSVPLKVKLAAHGFQDIEVSPSIPAAFGGYALVLDLGKHGRRLITSLVRTYAANPQPMQFPKQSLDDMGPAFLQRIGEPAIRMGVDYTPTPFVD